MFSSDMTSVSVATSNRPFPDEEGSVTQSNVSLASVMGASNSIRSGQTDSYNHQQNPQQSWHKQEGNLDMEGWSQYSSASASSSLKKKLKPRNPLKFVTFFTFFNL